MINNLDVFLTCEMSKDVKKFRKMILKTNQ